jgi:polyisoprenoid-binding protein YceI
MSMPSLSLLAPAAVLAGALVAIPAAAPSADSAESALTTSRTVLAESANEAYTFDSVHSCALFRVLHLGAGQFIGRFNILEGGFTFDGTGDSPPTFDVAIPIDSVDTNNGRLDGHLRSPDFFNATEHPRMTFKSTGAKKTGEKTWDVTGELTMNGVTRTITAAVEWTGTATMRDKRSGFEAIFTVKRSEFGIMYGVENGSLGDDTRITVSMEGVVAGG